MERGSEIVRSCMLKHVPGYELKIQADRGTRRRGETETRGKDKEQGDRKQDQG